MNYDKTCYLNFYDCMIGHNNGREKTKDLKEFPDRFSWPVDAIVVYREERGTILHPMK